MKVIIAGGSGWIGSALAHSLLADGHEVVVLSRTARPSTSVPGAHSVVWDGRTVGAWAAELAGCHAVVNLAGASVADGRWTEARKQLLMRSRIDPTTTLVNAMEQMTGTMPLLVSASAVGYYGDRGAEPLTEDAPPGHDFLAQLAVAWEASACRASELGARVVVARIGVVLGAEGALPRLAVPFRWFVGGPIGSGDQWISWVHLDDVVGMCRFAIDHPEVAGPMNVTAPHPVTNRELAEALANVLGRPSWIPVPGVALRVLFGELAESLLGGQRALPALAQRLGYDFREPDLIPALRQALDVAA
ncbi:MAG: uncharacterized protein QOF51_451 [Chloroflexota bacterium]|jgi:uncharacterized protein (TIGR01777 family)|nr:uncharacterized protein [Chloroflexota bacterium]